AGRQRASDGPLTGLRSGTSAPGHGYAGHTDTASADVVGGTRIAVIARGGVGYMRARAGPVADIVGAHLPVVSARRPRRLEAATRRATVAVGEVAVLAILARIQDTVQALRPGDRARAAVAHVGRRKLLAVGNAALQQRAAKAEDGPRQRVHAGIGIDRS